MLDSPYVRRVAISMQLLDLRFEHRSLSVFSSFTQFQQINPVVKAPTFVCDDGQVLMDSTLILQYAQALAGPRRILLPTEISNLQRVLRMVGLALAACDKSVQIVYEHHLRPTEKLHQPWLNRVTDQLLRAYEALEAEMKLAPPAATSETIDQGGLTAAVAWYFTQQMLPGVVVTADHPTLSDFSARVEALPEFVAAPYGSSVCHGEP